MLHLRNLLYKRMAEVAANGLGEGLLLASLEAPEPYETPEGVQQRRYKFFPVAMSPSLEVETTRSNQMAAIISLIWA